VRTSGVHTSGVRIRKWQPSFTKQLMAKLAYPVILLLNRPSLSGLADLAYDFALRCNGIAITFAGREGLTKAEENFLRRVRDRLQGGVLIDIGANHGAYARMLRRMAPSARVIAFEPHPLTFDHLQRSTVAISGIELVNKALGADSGEFNLYDFREADGSTQASLSEAAVALYSTDIVEHRVCCTTVDEFMAEAELARIDFLKIDTEGHDLSVLKGARYALREKRIGMIQFEFVPANIATGVSMRDFFEVLSGYRIGRLCLNGALRPLDSYDVKRCEIYVTQNLIAEPR
jgi:FkbM family methyltransferase